MIHSRHCSKENPAQVMKALKSAYLVYQAKYISQNENISISITVFTT